MTRKDTILISVIINAGLLAILFATAIIYDTDQELIQSDLGSAIADATPPTAPEQPIIAPLVKTEAPPADEVDNVLRNYSANPQSGELEQETIEFQEPPTPVAVQSEPTPPSRSDYVEVTVKKGDSLDKIARANGTTVNAIKKASQLTSEKLTIGQVLRVPLTKEAKAVAAAPQVKAVDSSEGTYHVVKSGESPWKIAKMYGVKYEDILRLNKLDEEKARNLKVGDKIRVK
jgi:LysM repeat protein